MTFFVYRVAFFLSKCKTLVRLEVPKSYRTYDTITVCDTFCDYVVSYLVRRSYDRCSISYVRSPFVNSYPDDYYPDPDPDACGACMHACIEKAANTVY